MRAALDFRIDSGANFLFEMWDGLCSFSSAPTRRTRLRFELRAVSRSYWTASDHLIGESDDGGVYLSHLHLRGVRLRREGGWGPLPLFPTGRVSLGEVACGLGSASHSSHECTTRFSVETGIFGGDLPLLHVPVRLGATSSFGRLSTPRRSAG